MHKCTQRRIKWPLLLQTRSLTTLSHALGFPEKLQHYMGGESESRLFKRLEGLSSVMHPRTTPCHPQRKWFSGKDEPNSTEYAANSPRNSQIKLVGPCEQTHPCL